MEKPVAVCPAGARRTLSVPEGSERKGLKVVAETQGWHQPSYRYLIGQIHVGALDEIVAASAYWVGDYEYYPGVPREAGWSDMEWQLPNWNYFTWLAGDHFGVQHVYHLDGVNWMLQAFPVRCLDMGCWQQRTDPVYSHVYDLFSVQYEYPGGVWVQSLCRQMKNTDHRKHPDGHHGPHVGVYWERSNVGFRAKYESRLDLTPPEHPRMGDVPVPPVAIPGEHR